MSVVKEIRRATKPMHDELEGSLELQQRLLSVAARKSIMIRFHALYSVAEAALRPHLRFVPGLEFDQRRKLPALRSDLRALGVPTAERCLEPTATLPAFAGVEQALGFSYVLEGATLGGHVIRKRVAAAGGSLVGMRFFDVYGPARGDRWKQFCAVLERQCEPHAALAVEGALAGFEFVRAALVDPGENEKADGPASASAMSLDAGPPT